MVGIVGGNALGLVNGQQAPQIGTGQQGSRAGSAGENAWVNAASGNLVLQHQDEVLKGLGFDVSVLRTYNSQAKFTDDNNDAWWINGYRRIVNLTGTVNTAGSSIQRVDADGSVQTYTYDTGAALYRVSDGSGKTDTLSWNTNTQLWVWTNTAGMQECYEASGTTWRLTAVVDRNGNSDVYSYTGNLLSKITDANGESIEFIYTGNNLTQERVKQADGTYVSRTWYSYDAQNRLSQVKIDLSPNDNSIADGKVYTTTYTYVGTTNLIQSVSQSDGSVLSLTYVTVNGENRVASMADALGYVTSFSYDVVNKTTTVTDALGGQTIYTWDAANRFTSVQGPTVNGVVQKVVYAYDAAGHLVSAIDANGNETRYTYDNNGNMLSQQDALGDRLEKTWNAANQLLTSTIYKTPATGSGGQGAALPQTTHYVYDASNNLRFVVSAEGRVTEYRYNGYGQLVNEIGYPAAIYIGSELAGKTSLTLSQLSIWQAIQSAVQTARTDYQYDNRGQLKQTTRYASVNASGVGVADGTQSVTLRNYDTTGNLLSQIDPNNKQTSYVYDGLGRLLSTTDPLGNATLNSYDDAGHVIRHAFANGRIDTETRDLAGHLISYVQGSLPPTQYRYDALGRLWQTIDASGNKSYHLYDAQSNRIADIDPTGAMTEYSYDGNGRQVRQVSYATVLTSTQKSQLAGLGPASHPSISSFRPATTPADRICWQFYDEAGRPSKSIDASGYVAENIYDGAGQFVSTKRYAQPLDVTGTTPSGNLAGLASVDDRSTFYYYDQDGQLTGTIDGEGYAIGYTYDSAGRKTVETHYAKPYPQPVTATPFKSGAALSPDDITIYYLYDGKGQLVGRIGDAGNNIPGLLTEYVYDAAGNKLREIRYPSFVSAGPSTRLEDARGTASIGGGMQTTSYTWTARNQMETATTVDGTVTRYTYDAMGNLTATVAADGTSEARQSLVRYDQYGRIIATLSGENAARLTAGLTQTQVDTIWAQYGTQYGYNSIGLKTSLTDGSAKGGSRTLFAYDEAGHLVAVSSGLSQTTRQTWNSFGELTETRQFALGVSPNTDKEGHLSSPITQTSVNDRVTGYAYDASGNRIRVTDALGNVTESAFNAFGQVVQTRVGLGDGRIRQTDLHYDHRGLLLSQTDDAGGALARTSYQSWDAFGRRVQTVDALGHVSTTQYILYNYDGSGRQVQTTDSSGTVTTCYDAFDRMLSRTDELGNVTHYSYDTANRAVTITTAEGVSTTTVANRHGQTVSMTDGGGNTTRYDYDRSGNLVKVTDARGYVTTHDFDALNHEIQMTDARGVKTTWSYDSVGRQIRRIADIDGRCILTDWKWDYLDNKLTETVSSVSSGYFQSERVTSYSYDAIGQLLQVIQDPGGLAVKTSYRYDAEGRTLTVTQADGTPQARVTRYQYDVLGRRIAETVDPAGLNITTRYSYDAADNLRAKTEPNGVELAELDTPWALAMRLQLGYARGPGSPARAADLTASQKEALAARYTTTYDYDAVNRLVKTTDAAGNSTQTVYDAAGNVVKVIDPRGNPAYFYFDSQHRVTAQVDAEGYLTTTDYDLATGKPITVIHYLVRLTGAISENKRPTAPVVTSQQKAVTHFTYDALGHLLSTTDAEGHAESYTWDALGNKASYTNKLGGTTTYVYDSRGNLIQETLPVFTKDAGGQVIPVINKYEYDALGNRITTIEASGAQSPVGQRVTRYTYDKLGRLLSTMGEFCSTYDATTNSYSYANPIQKQTWDANGNVLSRTDAKGYTTWYFYDHAGRQVAQVSADNTLTTRQYDAAGNLIDQRVYATPLKGSIWQLAGPVADPADSNFRETIYTYDVANRLIETRIPGVLQANKSDTATRTIIGTGDIVQSSQYNKAGLLVVSTDANGNKTTIFYDKLGQKRLQIDAAGYGVAWTRDGEGNVLTESHFAKCMNLDWSLDSDADQLIANWPKDNTNDRITDYTWDLNGRCLSETHHNVLVGSVNISNGKLITPTLTNATTRYQYDAAGNQTRKTDAAGNVYDWEFDYLGRKTAEILPTMADYTGRQIRARTDYEYNGLNQCITVTRRGDTAAQDEVIRYGYFSDGQIIQKTGPNGTSTSYAYDANGNLTLTAYMRTNAAGIKIYEQIRISYDAMNREVNRISASNGNPANNYPSSDWKLSPATTVQWDAFGEVIARGTGTGAPQEFTQYDNAGRAIKTNSDRGITRAYLYDGNGNATVQIESQAVDLRALSMEQIVSSQYAGSIFKTVTVYDARNQVIDVIQPSMDPTGARYGLDETSNPIIPGSSDLSVQTQGTVTAPAANSPAWNTGAITAAASTDSVPLSVGSVFTMPVQDARDSHIESSLKFNIGLNLPDYHAIAGSYELSIQFKYTSSGFKTGYLLYGESSQYNNTDTPNGGDAAQPSYEGYTLVNPAAGYHEFQLEACYTGPVHLDQANYYLDITVTVKDISISSAATLTTFTNNITQPAGTLAPGMNTGTVANPGTSSRTYSFTGSSGMPSATLLKIPDQVSDNQQRLIFVRPLGSTGAYQQLAIGSVADNAAIDISGLPQGDYELQYINEGNSTNDPGNASTLYRRETYILHNTGNSATIDKVSQFVTNDAFNASANGTFIQSNQGLWLTDVRSKDHTEPDHLMVSYRPSGSSGAWVTVRVNRVNGLVNAFNWDQAGLPPGAWEVRIGLCSSSADPATGTDVFDTLVGTVNSNGNALVSLVSEGTSWTGANVFILQNLPDNADTVSKLVFTDEQGHQFDLSGAASFDASHWLRVAMPDAIVQAVQSGAHTYTIQIEATSKLQSSALVYRGSGSLTLGNGGDGKAVIHAADNIYHLQFDPDQPKAASLAVYYRQLAVNAADYDVPFTRINLYPRADGSYRWDSVGLDASAEYEYYYDILDSNGVAISRFQGYFVPKQDIQHGTYGTTAYSDIASLDLDPGGALTIHRQQTHNAFGEVDSETDGRGLNANLKDPSAVSQLHDTYTTRMEYDTLGHLVRKTDPAVSITLANGFQKTVNPVTSYAYDLAGNVIAETDANGNVTTQLWTMGTGTASVLQTWNAGGLGSKTYGYDMLGDRRYQVDEIGRRTDYSYDKNHQLIQVDHASIDGSANGARARDTYKYDELGQRISHTQGSNQNTGLDHTDTTDYDMLGRVTRTVSAAGRATRYDYTFDPSLLGLGGIAGGWITTTTDANGRTLIDYTDTFGRTTRHIDLGGHQFDYAYNFAGLLTQQSSTSYTYYNNGLMKTMSDSVSGIVGYYEYDRNGNRTFEGLTGQDGNYYFQQSTVTWDAMNRMVKIEDGKLDHRRYVIDYEYDAVGNRRRMRSAYSDAINGQAQVQDYWYSYDAMNRFTVTMGALVNGTRALTESGAGGITASGIDGGVTIAYDNASQRVQAIYGSDGHREDYRYDGNGILTFTDINGITRAKRDNDLFGRNTAYQEWDPATGQRITYTTRTWDNDNLQMSETHEAVNAVVVGDMVKPGDKRSGTTFTRDADGTLRSTQTWSEDSKATTVRTDYAYMYWDSARQLSIRTQASNSSVKGWAPGFSEFTYDSAGHVTSATDFNYQGGRRRFQYQMDGEGHILQRDEYIDGQQNRFHSYYFFDGHEIGNIGNDGVKPVDYASELAQHAAAANSKTDDSHKRFAPVAVADFDENYQPVNSLYPGTAPGTYTVQQGDTLRLIALRLWGDGDMWYLIADVNGLLRDDNLTPNTTLVIPNKVTNIHNNTSTFKVYNAGDAIGNTQPTLPDPPPPPQPKHGGCGGVGMVLAVVVAIVATVFTAGAAAVALGAVASGTGFFAAGAAVLSGAAGFSAAAIGAAAIGGAIGSAASQGFLMATGAQQSFNWKGVAMGAVGAAVTAGIGGYLTDAAKAAQAAQAVTGVQAGTPAGVASASTVPEYFNVMGRQALGNALTQGAGVATGLQHSFDWRGLAATAVAAGVSYSVGRALSGIQDMNPFAQRLAGGLSAGLASAEVRGNLSSQNIGYVAMDAVASTVGNQIADSMASSSAPAALTDAQSQAMVMGYGPLTAQAAAGVVAAGVVNNPNPAQLDDATMNQIAAEWRANHPVDDTQHYIGPSGDPDSVPQVAQGRKGGAAANIARQMEAQGLGGMFFGGLAGMATSGVRQTAAGVAGISQAVADDAWRTRDTLIAPSATWLDVADATPTALRLIPGVNGMIEGLHGASGLMDTFASFGGFDGYNPISNRFLSQPEMQMNRGLTVIGGLWGGVAGLAEGSTLLNVPGFTAPNSAQFEQLKGAYRTSDPWVFDINNPARVWGMSSDQLAEGFRLSGYDARYTQARISSSEVYTLDGHPEVAQFQYTPAAGATHEGQYYKFTLHDETEIKIVDPSSYNSGTILPKTTIFNPQGQQLIKVNGNWVVVK